MENNPKIDLGQTYKFKTNIDPTALVKNQPNRLRFVQFLAGLSWVSPVVCFFRDGEAGEGFPRRWRQGPAAKGRWVFRAPSRVDRRDPCGKGGGNGAIQWFDREV